MKPNNIFHFKTLFFTLFLIAFMAQGYAQRKKNQESSFKPVEVRAYMDAFFGHFAGIVEEAADSIKRSTDNDQVKAATLLWKMNAIPAAQSSIFTTSPIEALIDANVLCIQMDHFFKDGNGKNIFGEQQHIANIASRHLRHNVNELLKKFLDGSFEENAMKEVQFFALNHPIQSIYFNRASTKPLISSMFENSNDRFKDVAQDMNQSIKDLNNRINFFTDIMPKQIRWQSEYLMYDVTPDNIKALEKVPLDSIVWQLDSLTALAYTMPGMVDSQRKLFFEYLTKERQLVVQLIQAERELAFDVLQAERAIIIEEVNKQRELVFEDSDQLIEKTVDDSFVLSKEMLDYTIWRVILILIGIFIGLAVLIILYKKL